MSNKYLNETGLSHLWDKVKAYITNSAITGISTSSPLSGSGTSGSVTISHANSGVTAASKGDTSAQTPGFGSTFKALSGTVNATGHLTAFAEHTVKIPNAAATTSAAGLMSSDDKTKLNGIATGAEVNQNAFSNVKVGSTTVAADAKTDTLEFVAGSNVTLTPDATNDKVTIAATDTTYSDATTSVSGLMSSGDKTKLNGIATGAEVNQNAFSNVKVGSTTVAADSKTDTLELVAGSNITLTPDSTNDKVTIAATDTTYSAATTSADGLMSSVDKTKLDGIDDGAEVNQNAFGKVWAYNDSGNVLFYDTADEKTDTLFFLEGDNVTLESVTLHLGQEQVPAMKISSSDTTYSPATATPIVNGTATVGTSTKYAREDHVHPTDTSRAASSHNHAASNITSGTLALARGGTNSDNTAAAINKVFAGPSSGSAGNASFRSLVAADLPTVTIAKGGTGATDRLTAFKNLTNQAVSTPTHVVSLTSNWATAGYTTIAQLTTTLGIACTKLWNGTLQSSNITFTYGGYNAYIVMGKPSGGSFMSVIIPAGTIGTSDTQWQLADDGCYISFKIKYSGTTGTLTYVTRTSGSSGQINYVYGIK